MMLRQRLVRQGAMGSGDTPPQPRKDQPALFRQLSSDSLDRLLDGSNRESDHGNRRHSVACGAIMIDIKKPSLKSAFNSAIRRMSDVCAFTPRAPSPSSEARFKEPQVVLPSVLSTFRRGLARDRSGNKVEDIDACYRGRRFSTSDSPPPSYQEAISSTRQISSWKTAAWIDFRRPKKRIDSSTNTTRIDQD